MKIDVGQAEVVTLQVDAVSVSRSAAQGMVFVSLGGHTLGLTEKQAGIVGRWLTELTQEDPVAEEAARLGRWHKWGGGACPVGAETRVEIERRDGMHGKGLAGKFSWAHGIHIGTNTDIVAYRVVP